MSRDDKGRFSTGRNGEISSEHQVLLGEYIESLQQQKRDTSESTVDTRKREVRYWLSFCESNTIEPLEAVETDVRGYIQAKSHLEDTTIGSYYRSVQSFYSIVENDARNDNLTLEHGHPCPDKSVIDLKNDYGIHESQAAYRTQHSVSPDSVDGARQTGSVFALQPDKARLLFDAVPGKTEGTRLRNEILVRLSWYTGCRSIELSRLKIQNIDWDRCSINVKSAKLNAKENPDLIRRDVFFPQSFRFTLKRWCERVRHAFCTVCEANHGNILVTEQSDSMDPVHINDIIKNSAHNAGVQQPLRPAGADPETEEIKEWLVTSHRIRRSAISHWVNDIDELDLHQVKRIAGHARIQQTMEYVEPDDDKIQENYQRGMRE